MYYLIQALTLAILSPLINSFANTHITIPAYDTSSIVPNVNLLEGFPNLHRINAYYYTKDKNVIIVGLSGALTPTWSSLRVPSYLNNQDTLINLGINEVIVYCANDPAVMQALGQDQNIDGSNFTFLVDPTAEFTDQLKMKITNPGP